MSLKINQNKFSKVSRFLKIVSEENRLKIILALRDRAMNVTEIHEKLRLPQNLTSHHISRLKEMGLLNEKHKGTFRHYSLNTKKIKELSGSLSDLIGA